MVNLGSASLLLKFIKSVPMWIGIPCYQIQENIVQRSEVPYCIIQQLYSEAMGQSSNTKDYIASRTIKYVLQLDCYSYRVGVKHATTYLEELSLVLTARSTYASLFGEGYSLNKVTSVGRVEFEDDESSKTILRAIMEIEVYLTISTKLHDSGYVDKIEGRVDNI